MPHLTHLDYKRTKVRTLDVLQVQNLFAELMTDRRITSFLLKPVRLPSIQMKLNKQPTEIVRP